MDRNMRCCIHHSKMMDNHIRMRNRSREELPERRIIRKKATTKRKKKTQTQKREKRKHKAKKNVKKSRQRQERKYHGEYGGWWVSFGN